MQKYCPKRFRFRYDPTAFSSNFAEFSSSSKIFLSVQNLIAKDLLLRDALPRTSADFVLVDSLIVSLAILNVLGNLLVREYF